jgi:acyl dehydratase
VHTNFEYCKKNTASGEPIAHGPLVYAMSAGLQYASGVNDGTLLALLQIDGWRMIAPVVHGDTIRMITRILEKKESSKPDRGVVTLKRTIVNQRNETVQEMQAKLLYRRRVQ